MMKRVTPSKSTARRKPLFTRDGVRGLVVTTTYWPWLLSGHKAVGGIFEPPGLPGVGAVDAGPGEASGGTCSGGWAVPSPTVPRVDGAGLGRVVGDVAPPLGVGLVWGAGADAALVVGSWAWAVVPVTAMVATGAVEATGGRVGSEVVLERVGVGPLAVPATGWAADVWTAGACVDTSGAWGPEGGVGLAVGLPGACWEGLRAPAVVPAAG